MPNHVAPDHPWAESRTDCLLPGSDEDLGRIPSRSCGPPAACVARAAIPYFPPWPDVVQLNAFAPDLRDAVAETLLDIAAQCDGMRCDMAMLMTNEVFARTWGGRAVRPRGRLLAAADRRVQGRLPGLLFIAEAYWDME